MSFCNRLSGALLSVWFQRFSSILYVIFWRFLWEVSYSFTFLFNLGEVELCILSFNLSFFLLFLSSFRFPIISYSNLGWFWNSSKSSMLSLFVSADFPRASFATFSWVIIRFKIEISPHFENWILSIKLIILTLKSCLFSLITSSFCLFRLVRQNSFSVSNEDIFLSAFLSSE